MNWSSPRHPLPAGQSRKSVQLEKILANSQDLAAQGRYDEAIAELGRKGGAILRESVGQMMLGSILSLTGRTEKALAAFDAAVRLAPKSAQAHFNRGFAFKQLGRPADAAAAYETALRIDPNLVEARHNLAVVLNEMGRLDEALVAADAAIRLKPAAAEAHYNRGIVLAGLGRHEEALAAYDRSLKYRPAYPEARIARGSSLRNLGRLDEAADAFAAALELDPRRIDALVAKALVLREAGRLEDALTAIEQAVRQNPGNLEARFAQASILEALERKDEALAIYGALIERDPHSVLPRVNQGNILRSLDRFEEALAAFDEVLSRAPDMLAVHLNRATVLTELDRFEEALAAYDDILQAADSPRSDSPGPPDSDALGRPEWEALAARANALRHLYRFDEALADFDRALAKQPDTPAILSDRSLLFLLLGRMEEGWPGYEFRGASAKRPPDTVDHSAPHWSGEPLDGKRLLVTGEQGLGDIIQFSRYLPPLITEAAEVRLVASPRLHRLLGSGIAGVTCAEKVDPAEPFDFQIRLLSIPGVRGTSLATIPGEAPYLLPEADRVAVWRDRLPQDGLRVGIHWQGNKEYGGDRRRSLALAQFAPLAAIAGVRLISLQKGEGLEQIDNLPPGMKVETFGEEFDAGPDAFLDTAAVMQMLDLVVSSDSAVVHLAGALGRPVWVLLPHVPDWRWLLGREDSPWYPTARLFRQPRSGDWESVFLKIAEKAAMLGRTKPL